MTDEARACQGQELAMVPPGTPGTSGIHCGLDPAGAPAIGEVLVVTVEGESYEAAKARAMRLARLISASTWLALAACGGGRFDHHLVQFCAAAEAMEEGDRHPKAAAALCLLGDLGTLRSDVVLDAMERLVLLGVV